MVHCPLLLDHLSDEIVRLATVLDQERAVLARGAPDAIQRAELLVQQLNEIDPYYRFEITTDGARSSVKIMPQYRGAERDRPIGVQAQFLFPDDEEGRAAAEAFRRSIDFGTPVTVPAQYLQEITLDMPAGLGGTFREGTLEVRPSGPVTDPRTFIFACVGPGESTMAEIPIDLTLTSQGSRGAILEGKDVTGILTARPARSADLASNGWSEQTYAAYLAQIHAWAEVGCDAETVERFIFQDEDDMRGNLWSK